MTFQQRAIEFFSTTNTEYWDTRIIVAKLKELAEDYPMDQGPNQYTRTTLSKRIDNHGKILDRILQRLTALEKPFQPEISSPPDDDAPL